MKPTYGEQLGLSGIAANNLLRRKHKGVTFSIPPRLQFSHTRCTFMTELNDVSITMRQVSSSDQYRRWLSNLRHTAHCRVYTREEADTLPYLFTEVSGRRSRNFTKQIPTNAAKQNRRTTTSFIQRRKHEIMH